MLRLNNNQEKILKYLRERVQDGLPPSVRDICYATGIKSTSTVHAHLKTLERDGYISREAGLNRAIHISGVRNLQIPIVTRFDSYSLSFSSEDIEGYVSFTEPNLYKKDIIAVRIFDESMKEYAILPGDVIFLCKTETFKSEDTVVVLYRNKILVRRIKVEDDVICLVAGNSRFLPILLEDTKIVGKAIGVTRYY